MSTARDHASTISREAFDCALAEWTILTGSVVRFWRYGRHVGDDALDAWPSRICGAMLYFARGPGRAVKIGLSRCPAKRIVTLNSEPERRVRAPWLGTGFSRLVLEVSGCGMEHEQALHGFLRGEQLRAHGGPLGRREWFRGEQTELLLSLACRLAVAA